MSTFIHINKNRCSALSIDFCVDISCPHTLIKMIASTRHAHVNAIIFAYKRSHRWGTRSRHADACQAPHVVHSAPLDMASTYEPDLPSQQLTQQPVVTFLAQAPPRGPTAVEGSLLMMTALVGLQFIALVGATVTGVLARRRRLELESINVQLRTINLQLRRQREDVQGEALTEALESVDPAGQGDTITEVTSVASIAALEASLAAPAAAHPTEGFGTDGQLSLAGVRRRLSACLRCAFQHLKTNPNTPKHLKNLLGELW